MGKGGEIFVLDMGQPIRISYLAEQMVRLSGKEPGKDVEIIYTGLRPGEKLFEELFHEQEALGKTSHSKIFLSHSRRMDWKKLEAKMRDLRGAVDRFDESQLKSLLVDLVPEFLDGREAKVNNVVPISVAAKAEPS